MQWPAVTHANISQARKPKGYLKTPGPQHVSIVAVSRRNLPIAELSLCARVKIEPSAAFAINVSVVVLQIAACCELQR